jgi:RimJ/RimL family protein N-acetyltransferase
VSQLSTPRLSLRQWRASDLEPFAELNADEQVMRYFTSLASRAESDAVAERARANIARDGWGLWAVEVRGVAEFIGLVGLNRVGFDAHFTPAIEVGWRLDRRYWGHGYATEAAQASLDFAFEQLGCSEVVSFTTVTNEPSRRVMERLGMTNDRADDFDHPSVDGPLRRHVLYRISRRR